MIYVIEEGAIANNHKDSAVAKWLEERGFALKNPEDMWHRVGPWIFVDDEEMYYRYCPHFGTGPSDVFADVHFRFEEFKAIWTAVMSARARKAKLPRWQDRVRQADDANT